jgi:uncharacterized membrane protein
MDADPLVVDYLGRLRAATWPLPAHRRDELVAEVAEHIEAALAAAGAGDEATVRNVLERLGEPESIAAAEVGDVRQEQPAGPVVRVVEPNEPRRPEPIAGGIEILAILVLALGGIVPVLGVAVGYALTFLSTRWTGKARLYAGLLIVGVAAAAWVLHDLQPDSGLMYGSTGPAIALASTTEGGWLASLLLILALLQGRNEPSR